MKGEDGLFVIMGNSPKVLLEHGALCYWGLTNNLQLKAKPVFSFSLTSFFEIL